MTMTNDNNDNNKQQKWQARNQTTSNNMKTTARPPNCTPKWRTASRRFIFLNVKAQGGLSCCFLFMFGVWSWCFSCACYSDSSRSYWCLWLASRLLDPLIDCCLLCVFRFSASHLLWSFLQVLVVYCLQHRLCMVFGVCRFNFCCSH